MITKELLIFVVQRTKNRLMQDWSKYIERPIADVLPELAAEDFRVANDECAISGFRIII